jgi:hypothetical protein
VNYGDFQLFLQFVAKATILMPQKMPQNFSAVFFVVFYYFVANLICKHSQAMPTTTIADAEPSIICGFAQTSINRVLSSLMHP